MVIKIPIDIKNKLKEYDINVNKFSEVLDCMCYISDIAIEYFKEFMKNDLKLTQDQIDKIDIDFEIEDTEQIELGEIDNEDSDEDIDEALDRNDKCNISLNFNVEKEIDDDSDYEILQTLNDPKEYTFDSKTGKVEFYKLINEWIEKCKNQLKDILTNDDFEEF